MLILFRFPTGWTVSIFLKNDEITRKNTRNKRNYLHKSESHAIHIAYPAPSLSGIPTSVFDRQSVELRARGGQNLAKEVVF